MLQQTSFGFIVGRARMFRLALLKFVRIAWKMQNEYRLSAFPTAVSIKAQAKFRLGLLTAG
ncbi:MAG: hypothetical protein FWD62_04730 [Betaproteobacteria bacterium]|nr:hypothetical protein [Betaproteobacteria bacterium]